MKNELDKCLLCKNPFCTTCPAGTKVRDVIELVRAGKDIAAGEMLFENNPLSAITGAVCPNHLYCMGACILNRKGNPVDFSKIEREVSGKYLDSIQKKRFNIKSSGKKVLIAGSGPAGLALAYYLRKHGHAVEVWEKEEKFGGMLRYGIPDFRVDKTIIDKLVTVFSNMGIVFKNNMIVDIKQIQAYLNVFDKVVLAVGAGFAKKMSLEGENLPHVIGAVDYLKMINVDARTPEHIENVVVIGGGNVAIDCALAAAHCNHKSVTLCYRKNPEDMKCYPEELSMAREKNVKFEFQMTPKKITPVGAIFTRGGQNITVPACRVVVAIGQTALERSNTLQTERGFIKTNNFQTNIKNVYALGDAVTGTATIVKAVAAAKELANLF